MSLINEALKKAQRQRTDEPIPTPSAAGGSAGGRTAKHGQPLTANLMVLIGSGALVLVVVTVVITFYFGNRPAPAKSTPSASANPAPTKPVETSVTAPVTAPVIKPTSAPEPSPVTAPIKEPAPAIAIASAAVGPAMTKIETPPASPPAPAPVTEPAVAPPNLSPPVASTPKTDERIHTFLDNVRITGVRTSGNESRVLMNDRVFRINDLVDRALGIRLIKVETNSLTFSDASGAIYVKNL